MSNGAKILVTEDGSFDLTTYRWDDRRFSAFLVKGNPIEPELAMSISKFLREEIARMNLTTITMSIVENIIEAKLLEYGLAKTSPIKLDKSIFTKNMLPLSDNAIRVLERRYLKTDSSGNTIETPVALFRRVAHHIARAEEKYTSKSDADKMEDVFYRMMTELKFLPNSPTLMNADRRLGQLAACFVLPIEDSMEGIFDSLKNAAMIHKSGGGTGFSFSRLRAKESRVGTTGGIASGPVSFMKIFDTATEQVKQGGTRRGANMAILRVDHPDIMEFIESKNNDRELSNFNISVAVTDSFMKAVRNGASYDLIDPMDNKKLGDLDARAVYNTLVTQAWKNGDPGIIFLDRINEDNPTPEIGEIESTNPCGEQPLLPFEACNLGSINLARFVVKDSPEDSSVIDFNSLKDIVWSSVRFLDNTIDMSKYPLPEIDRMVKGNRKIGLGVMGFADMLFLLNVPYDSEEALDIAEQVMSFIQTESHDASRSLAEERGAFGNFDKSIFKDMNGGGGYRNATTTTIAPTGTLSIIADSSSGIEPLFALSFVRNVMDNDQLLEVNPYFERKAKESGFYSEELMNKIARKGSIRHMEEVPESIRKVFVTAHDVAPEWHVRMQAAFQKHTDNAVSKTVNLPKDVSSDDVLKIYNLAYELGLKGVTIYRDGSKKNQVLSFTEKDTPQRNVTLSVKDRPETLEGFTTKMETGMGNLYVTVTEFNEQPFEVFATIGKSGRSTTAKTEAIGRLVSLCLRASVKVEHIINQLKGIGGEHPVFQKNGLVLSIPDAIARVLENRYMKDTPRKKGRKPENSLLGETCPECGQTISFEEGCMTCHFCGFSKCG
jgi:ribonucleoside-diphosphate reductase alpha chain